MSLSNKFKNIKHNLRNVNNFTNAKVFISHDSKSRIIKNFQLELNGIFKMAIIDYRGYIKSVLKTEYPGFSIKYVKGKMIIRNTLKIELKNNLLFQFLGTIEQVSQARIYTWGKGSIIAEIQKVTQTPNTVNFDDNLVNISDKKFIDFEFTKPKTQELLTSEEKKSKENIKKIKRLKYDNIIHGLYTKGNAFTYKGMFYKGYYHYNTNKKMFMTGKNYNFLSEELKKIYGGKRS